MKLTKAEKSELLAGMFEGAVTTSVILFLIMIALGIRLFIALIPIIIMVTFVLCSVTITASIFYFERAVKLIESAYKEDANSRDVLQETREYI